MVLMTKNNLLARGVPHQFDLARYAYHRLRALGVFFRSHPILAIENDNARYTFCNLRPESKAEAKGRQSGLKKD
jgi:hypothetical protein